MCVCVCARALCVCMYCVSMCACMYFTYVCTCVDVRVCLDLVDHAIIRAYLASMYVQIWMRKVCIHLPDACTNLFGWVYPHVGWMYPRVCSSLYL